LPPRKFPLNPEFRTQLAIENSPYLVLDSKADATGRLRGDGRQAGHSREVPGRRIAD
jgi:hypothetical protein